MRVGFTLLAAYCLAVLFTASSASADLVVNGDFSDTTNGNVNGVSHSELNLGWRAKGSTSNTGWDWHGGTGTGDKLGAAYDVSAASNRAGIAQANEITTETGNAYNLEFDWTQQSTGTDVVHFQVIGYKLGSAFDSAASTFVMPSLINGPGLNVQRLGTVANGASWTDLTTGILSTGHNTPSSYGTSTPSGLGQTFALNFGGDNIEDFDRIAIAFTSSSTGGTPTDGIGIGGILDNVSITAAVPEPSSLTLLGLGIAGVVARRRR